ncbi:hypothetical protein A6395_15250 [Exiguobacterium sp. SH31]|uniref:hypothetical protein n=1 Tax=Exiguobacterium sp. SH31 TaxID=1843183 RepID=UPI0008ADF75A|nr:hypothetical protein [Exiguobacterium sp. SH31]OGX77830.1 hypothetical protein A6395_15250 [Exiguobacterium sp. SH31]
MGTYTIDYHTGVMREVDGELDQVKRQAVSAIAYTQENVSIRLGGEVVTTARWYGLEPEEDDDVLTRVGDGFYQMWDDEIEG